MAAAPPPKTTTPPPAASGARSPTPTAAAAAAATPAATATVVKPKSEPIIPPKPTSGRKSNPKPPTAGATGTTAAPVATKPATAVTTPTAAAGAGTNTAALSAAVVNAVIKRPPTPTQAAIAVVALFGGSAPAATAAGAATQPPPPPKSPPPTQPVPPTPPSAPGGGRPVAITVDIPPPLTRDEAKSIAPPPPAGPPPGDDSPPPSPPASSSAPPGGGVVRNIIPVVNPTHSAASSGKLLHASAPTTPRTGPVLTAAAARGPVKALAPGSTGSGTASANTTAPNSFNSSAPSSFLASSVPSGGGFEDTDSLGSLDSAGSGMIIGSQRARHAKFLTRRDNDDEPPSPPPDDASSLATLHEDAPPPPPPPIDSSSSNSVASSLASSSTASSMGSFTPSSKSRSAPASPMKKPTPSPSALTLAVAANRNAAAPGSSGGLSPRGSPLPSPTASSSGGAGPTRDGGIVMNANPLTTQMRGRMLVDGQPVPTPLAIDPNKPIEETLELLMARIVHMDRLVGQASKEKSAFLNKIRRLERDKHFLNIQTSKMSTKLRVFEETSPATFRKLVRGELKFPLNSLTEDQRDDLFAQWTDMFTKTQKHEKAEAVGSALASIWGEEGGGPGGGSGSGPRGSKKPNTQPPPSTHSSVSSIDSDISGSGVSTAAPGASSSASGGKPDRQASGHSTNGVTHGGSTSSGHDRQALTGTLRAHKGGGGEGGGGGTLRAGASELVALAALGMDVGAGGTSFYPLAGQPKPKPKDPNYIPGTIAAAQADAAAAQQAATGGGVVAPPITKEQLNAIRQANALMALGIMNPTESLKLSAAKRNGQQPKSIDEIADLRGHIPEREPFDPHTVHRFPGHLSFGQMHEMVGVMDGKSGITANLIKAKAGTFDLDSVFSLSLAGLQLTRLTAPGTGGDALLRCTELAELDVSHNALDSNALAPLIGGGSGVAPFPKLRVLDLSSNRITALSALTALSSSASAVPPLAALETLYLHGNQISGNGGGSGGSYDSELIALAKACPSLRTLYLKKLDGSVANPLCKNLANYRDRIRALFPRLTVLDGERLVSAGAAIYTLSESLANEAKAAATAATPKSGANGTAERNADGSGSDDAYTLACAGTGVSNEPLPSESGVVLSLAECRRLDSEAGAALDALQKRLLAPTGTPAAVAVATVGAIMASAKHASSYYTGDAAATAATTTAATASTPTAAAAAAAAKKQSSMSDSGGATAGTPVHRREGSIFQKLKRTISIAAGVPVSNADGSTTGGGTDGAPERSAVEQQTEASRQEGTVWDIVRKHDEKALADLFDRDPTKVDARGFVGECPLHMCFLYASPAHLSLAKYIIGRFPESIHQVYEKAEYLGENVLHISVINKNAEMVEWLLSDPKNVPYREKMLRAAATGNFFKINSPCYYGEYPLAFAACTNQWNLVELLIKFGADMDMVDSNGNTVLHLLVIHNLPEMYSKYKKCWIEHSERKQKADAAAAAARGAEFKKDGPKSEPLWKRLNADHLTPLTLSAKLGQKEMFSFLLDERKITQWTYGPVSCVLYPLDQLDLGLRGEGDVRAGALELIVNDAHVKLLMHPRLVDLVNTKWDRFASRVFTMRFATTLAYLFIFMFTTILGQTRYESEHGEGDDVVKVIEYPTGFLYAVRLAGDFMVLAGALWKGRREATEMMNM